MQRLSRRDALRGAAALAATACLTPAEHLLAAEPETRTITLLHVNDTHGRGVLPTDSSPSSVACAATIIKEVRKECGADNVCLTHGGDLLFVHEGDRLTRATDGEAEVPLLNHLEFDAMALGNHDFHSGEAHLKKLMEQAKFPMLSANVRDKATSRLFTKAFTIKKCGPVRVALFGLSPAPPDFWCVHAKDSVLDKPLPTARDLVPKLRKQADVVVALSHIAYQRRKGLDSDVALAGAVDGIDVILGGHSHDRVEGDASVKNPSGQSVLIAQGRWHWEYVVRVDLTLRRSTAGFEVISKQSKLIPVNVEGSKPDASTNELIARLDARYCGGR